MNYPYFEFNTAAEERLKFPDKKLWKQACSPYDKGSKFGYMAAGFYYDLSVKVNKYMQDEIFNMIEESIDSMLADKICEEAVERVKKDNPFANLNPASILTKSGERKEKTFGEVLAEKFPDTDETIHFNSEDTEKFLDYINKYIYEADRLYIV